ncbi:MAG: GAF domain-containing protein [Candidatus Rokuibacteriota bacterium]
MGSHGALTVEDLEAAAAEIAAARSATDTHAVVEALAQRALGHRLFTIMLLHEATEEVERVYSTRPDVYPVGGRKPKRGTAWGAVVIERGEVYLGRTADDIRWAFDDHPLILRLGLESVVNVPVRFRGRPLGTMNLLHEAGWYGPDDVPTGRLLASLLVPELLAAREPAARPAPDL